MEILKQKFYTKHIKPEEIVIVPTPYNFNDQSYYSLVSYKDIASKDISIPEVNNLILEAFGSKRPQMIKDPKSFNLDYYIVPGKTNIVVIDFDDLELTLEKIEYLCSVNEQFQLNWVKFKNEYLEKTFKVQSPTGGLHYYFRHQLVFDTRYVKAIKPEKILTKEELIEYTKKFPNKVPVAEREKGDKADYASVGVDVLASGVVGGAGNVSLNMFKKGILWKKREYKILKDIELKVLDEDIFNIMKQIFHLKSASESAKEWKEGLGKVKATKSKIKGNGLGSYDFRNLIKSEEQIESLTINSPDDLLRKYSNELVVLKISYQSLLQEKKNTIDYELDDLTGEIYEKSTDIDALIREELIKFKKEKKRILKDIYCKNPDTEYIFNSLRRYEMEEEYSKRDQLIYPKLLNDIDAVSVGGRSEKEMAFVVNLKVRNYEDPVIHYLLQRDFGDSLKSFENPNFLEQAILKAENIKKYPEELNIKGIWNEVILGYSLARKINYEKVFKHSGAKIRTLVETLYDNCSIRNSFEIKNKSQTHFSLGGIGAVSHKTIPKYLELLQSKKFFKQIIWVKGRKGKKLYPKRIILKNVSELKKLGWVKSNLLTEARYTPQDANQSFTGIKGVGLRGAEIIGYLRENGGQLSKKTIYKKFENIKDHHKVIRKNIKRLLELEIVSLGEGDILILNQVSLNGKYASYAVDYNNALKDEDRKATTGKKRRVREKKMDLIESRKDNCINEKNYMKNLLGGPGYYGKRKNTKKKSA